MSLNIFILDTDENHNNYIAKSILKNFKSYFFNNSYDFNKELAIKEPDIIICSNKIFDLSIAELKNFLKEYNYNFTKIIFFSDEFNIEDLITKIKEGVYYYFFKPVNLKAFEKIINEIINLKKIKQTTDIPKNVFDENKYYELDKIIGESEIIKNIREQIKQFADNENTVLISGPTGSGKDLIAFNIFKETKKYNKNFVKISCSTLPKNLIDNELFGHFKGAYTGAYYNKIGLIEAGNNGVIYIDEIDNLDEELQAKFLRLLDEKTFYKIGSDKVNKINCKFVISLSTDKIDDLIDKKIRKDLFFRISSFEIKTHYLREYIEDIEILSDYFNNFFASKYNKKKLIFNKKDIKLLQSLNWYGNVRELKNFIEKFIIEDYLNKNIEDFINEKKYEEQRLQSIKYIKPGMTLEQCEKSLIEETLKYVNYNISKASKLLGITYNSLNKRMEKFNITKEKTKEC
ncbi:MAG TPA: sigma 54-interacting transcriptional regulator [bacterium]|nr:sigma 54-interacting transcriptional regulator [bacterium]HOL47462.1 sigma 54-interacting transcriptional regulator [bacterium]HPQ18942.1 sigma 54-interacting transcriptional regulator [bacterium]